MDKEKRIHILVIAQYFYPEQFRINDICEEWVKKGYKVTVITGIPNYPEGKFFTGYSFFRKRNELYRGINIIRIPIVPRGNNSISLTLNYLSFVISGFFWKIFSKLNVDKVFIYEVSPMTQALPGVWFAKKKKIPCFLYVTDLWPDNVVIMTGIKNKTIIKLIGKMVDYIYNNTTKIFTASKSFVGAIENRGIPREKLQFWPQYAESFYHPEKQSENEIPQDEVFNLTFAGNIGSAQGLDVLPKAAKILKSKGNKVRFNIIGEGRYKKDLIKQVKDNNVIEYFNFIEKKAPEEIPFYLANSDVALVTLAKNKVFEKTIPAKMQSCLACGIPIIVAADGEAQQVIQDSEAGFFGNSGDYNQLANNIEKMLGFDDKELKRFGSNAENYYSQKFDKDMLLKIMDEYIGG